MFQIHYFLSVPQRLAKVTRVMCLGSETFLVRCLELNVFSLINAAIEDLHWWVRWLVCLNYQQSWMQRERVQNSPETDKSSKCEWLVTLLVCHVATGEAQAAAHEDFRTQIAGWQWPQICVSPSGCDCCQQHLDMPSYHHLFIKYNEFQI